MLKLLKEYRLYELIIVGIVISHIGWVFESCLFVLMYGGFQDRGFVTMPLCPIYGITVLIIYLLLGTPKEGGLVLSGLGSGGVRMLIYFALAALIPAVSELIGGEVMERVSGEVLWSYEGYKYAVGKYACLEIALSWSLLIIFAMCFFDKLLFLIKKMPAGIAKRLSISLSVLIFIDFVGNIARSIL